jgi:hypothetical protein
MNIFTGRSCSLYKKTNICKNYNEFTDQTSNAQPPVVFVVKVEQAQADATKQSLLCQQHITAQDTEQPYPYPTFPTHF